MEVPPGAYILNGAINEMSGRDDEMRILIIDDENVVSKENTFHLQYQIISFFYR